MSLAASPFRSADPLGAFHPATLGVAQGTPPPPRVVPVAAVVPSPPPPPSPPPATIRAQTSSSYPSSSSSSSSSARTLAARRAAVVRDALDLLEDLERAGRAGSDPRYSPAQARRDAVVRAVLEDLRDEIDDALTVDALMDDDDVLYDATYPGDPFFLEEDYGAEYERERESPRAAAAAGVSHSRDDPPGRYKYVAQDFVGGAMQSASFLLAAPHAEDPSFVDDWMRCSTLARPCTVAETLRRCTYEPKGSWYRERRSRVNAPLDWPYCEDDLATVYAEGCTEKELFAATCEPRIARSRAAAERARRREAERQRAIERGIRRASENF